MVEKTFEQEIYRSEKVRRFLLSEDNAASGDMSEVLLKQKHPRQLEEQVMSMQVPHVPSIPAGSHSEMQNIQLTVRNWIDRLYEETNDKFDRETGEKISLWKKSNPWVAMHNFVTAFDYYTYNPNTQAQKDYERKIELLMNALDNPVGKKKNFYRKTNVGESIQARRCPTYIRSFQTTFPHSCIVSLMPLQTRTFLRMFPLRL